MILGSCESCAFWHTGKHGTLSKEGAGECRVSEPKMVALPGEKLAQSLLGVWPETHKDDWCGKYKR